MKRLVVFSIVLLLGALVVSLAVGGEEEGKPVTLTGTMVCAKCTLKVEGQAACQNVLVVEKKGKKKQFYMTKNEVYDKFGGVCASKPQVTVTGTVATKDGVKWLTASEITAQEKQG